jgi:hypothetical protein
VVRETRAVQGAIFLSFSWYGKRQAGQVADNLAGCCRLAQLSYCEVLLISWPTSCDSHNGPHFVFLNFLILACAIFSASLRRLIRDRSVDL